MKKIINVVGARPNFMKMAPIFRQMQNHNSTFNPVLLHTGQHYDERMSKFFFEDLEMPEPEIYLGVGSGSHAEQTAKIMVEFENVCQKEKPDLVVVVGDVNSTMACSIVASKLWIPVAHVEAGLRSFDRRMPEEINRLVTDALSDYLFISEKSGLDNLRKEGIAKDKMHIVGNVMIDSLVHFLEKADASNVIKKYKLKNKEYVLVTLHRPSNVDSAEDFKKILNAFEVIQKDIPIIFPIHPRAEKNIDLFGLRNQVNHMHNLILTPPLGYLNFIQLEKNARFVITDSGGLQEETTFLGIPCLTVRKNTERTVTVEIGTNEIVGTETQKIIDSAHSILNSQWKKGKIPEYWDGQTAKRIIEILEDV
jgi:UDP-N-acetylglucosamine 2-epimerase (non-hydrolysing)